MSTYYRHQFTTIDELHLALKANHHKQTFRYRLNIEVGYYLVNTETSKAHFFYESENTSFYDLGEQPIINTSVDLVLRDIPNIATIIENMKRESTKRKFERLYEYVILTTHYLRNQSEVTLYYRKKTRIRNASLDLTMLRIIWVIRMFGIFIL